MSDEVNEQKQPESISPCTEVVPVNSKENGERRKTPLLGIVIALVLVSALMLIYTIGVGKDIEKDFRFNVFGREEVQMILNGSPVVTVNYGEEYDDPGAKALAGKNELAVIATKPDTKKIGKQTIVYSCTYDSVTHTIERELNVIDSTPPVITIEYTSNSKPTWLTGPAEFIVEATDNVDGDLTPQITSRTENGKTVYTVTDSSGNTYERAVPLQEEIAAPEIKLEAEIEFCHEDEPININAGYSAVDGAGNDLTEYVEIDSGNYDGNVEGTYEILYSLTNYKGETVLAEKTVIVARLRNPEYITDYGKTIFLTFDGGPTSTLYSILNTLAKYDVPATFFVSATTNSIQYISDIAAAGHSIGVYSYTNNLSRIYNSFEAFDDDFGKIQEVVSRATGNFTNLMRFPSGSATTYGQTVELQSYYENEGFRVIRWTADPGDGYTMAGAGTLADAAVASIREGYDNIIRLHDNSDATAAALEDIILWSLNNDYTFLRY